MALIVPNAGDTTGGNKYQALDQAEPDSLDFEILGYANSGVLSGGVVTTNSSNSNVAVSAAVIVLNGVPYSVSANATLGLPAAPADNRFDLVVVRVTAGTAALAVVSGANSSTNPSFPQSSSVITGSPSSSTNVIFSTDVVLAALYRSGSNTVTSGRIVDKRKMVSISLFDQGSAVPSTAQGPGPGHLYFRTTAPTAPGSGVYVQLADTTYIELAQNVGYHVPVGGGILWPSSQSVPSGFLEADGSAKSTSTYAALFAVFGYLYGGAGGTFNMPNYANKFIRGTTTPASVGTAVGADTVTLSTANLPVHSHTMAHTHTFAHTHGIDHTHPANTTDSSGSHTHTGTTDATTAQTYQAVPTTPGTAFGFVTSFLLLSSSISTANTLPHTHTFTTGSSGAHTHATPSLAYSGSTTSQSSSTTSASSAASTGNEGSASPFNIIPASVYSRWIIKY